MKLEQQLKPQGTAATYLAGDLQPIFGVCVTGGKVKLSQNLIEMCGNSVWETGASLHSCKYVNVITNRFETPDHVPRLYHCTTGLMLTENELSDVAHNEFTGIRIGVKITNMLPKEFYNRVTINHCSFQECSLGLSIDEEHYGGETEDRELRLCGSRPSSPTSPPKAKIRQDTREDKHVCCENTNLNIQVDNCAFQYGYYGVMNQSGKTRLLVDANSFFNISKAFVINWRNFGLATRVGDEKINIYRWKGGHALESTANHASAYPTKKNVEGLRQLLNMQLQKNDNLPYRIAYNKKKYFVITVNADAETYRSRCKQEENWAYKGPVM